MYMYIYMCVCVCVCMCLKKSLKKYGSICHELLWMLVRSFSSVFHNFECPVACFCPGIWRCPGQDFVGRLSAELFTEGSYKKKRYIATNMLPNDWKWYVWNISGQIPLHRVFNCPAPPRGPSYTCIYWSRSCELVSQCNYPLNPRIHSVHLETELNSSGLQVCLLHDLHFLAKLLAGNRFQAFRLKGSSSPAHLHYWSTG